jgi:hypothetical protein
MSDLDDQKCVMAQVLLPLCPYLHVLGDTPGIVGLPEELRMPDLVLRIGRDPLVMGMPDLDLTEAGFSATFVFRGARFFVSIPWMAVQRMWVADPFVGPVVVWHMHMHETKQASESPPKPVLRLVPARE